MKIPYVDLKAQYQALKPEMDLKVATIIENTAFIGGDELRKFSTDFATLYGVNHCIPLANGTDALFIAMKMMGVGYGDEVITTASSWISTSETISQTGATPVFVDIDEFNTINSSLIEDKITENTKVIIPVHLYGQMADMSMIMEIANKHDLKVIEDCAQSHFSELDGKRAGTWGDVGTFSFYPGKNLGAYGDAGALITNDDELAMKVKRYANHGSLKKHHHEVEGMNSRMDGLQAGVLNVKLPHIIKWTEERERVANRYFEGLDSVEGVVLPKVRINSKHSFHVFGIMVKNREKMMAWLSENNIASQVHYPKAMPFMPAYSYLNASPKDFPKAYVLQNEELSLPIYPEMTNLQIDFVVKKISEYVG